MSMYRRMKQVMVLLVSLSLLGTTTLPAYAGIVTTEQMIEAQFEAMDRASLLASLEREEVRRQLIERGVDPQYARDRIAALSDAQIAEMKAGIDELPAGSGVVGVLVAVILVLVILDIIGVTDIFSFIHPPR